MSHAPPSLLFLFFFIFFWNVEQAYPQWQAAAEPTHENGWASGWVCYDPNGCLDPPPPPPANCLDLPNFLDSEGDSCAKWAANPTCVLNLLALLVQKDYEGTNTDAEGAAKGGVLARLKTVSLICQLITKTSSALIRRWRVACVVVARSWS